MVQGAPIDGRCPSRDGRMVRSRQFNIASTPKAAPRIVVDMEKDPGEMVNLAGEAAHRDILLRHRSMLAQWQRKTKDTFPAVT